MTTAGATTIFIYLIALSFFGFRKRDLSERLLFAFLVAFFGVGLNAGFVRLFVQW